LKKANFIAYTMALTKSQKEKILAGLKEKIAQARAVILVGISGLKVKDISQLRKILKQKNSNIQVVKKTLAELAFKENKLKFDKEKFQEEIALVFGLKDGIIPAKTVYQFSQENKNLKILGGYIENEPKEADYIIALAQLPTREEFIAKLFFAAKSPLLGLYNALQRNLNILKVKS